MANKIYALLVGIDKYAPQSGVSSLQGCVNDIEAIEKYLEITTKNKISTENKNKWELVTQKLTNESATRQAVIDAFEQHLTQADDKDVVLFYYAGHGSYETVPKEFEALELNGRIETLVCHDSRISRKLPDLADKELSYLIEKVAQKNPHILIILDSCHSGTATRDPEVLERQTNSSGTARDLKDFIFDQEWINYRLSKDYQRPKHIAIAACRDFQTAKEYKTANGQRRGAFSYYLAETLARTNGSLSYANLVQDINALITGKVKDQSPQIEAKSDDLIQIFLGGAAEERIKYFTFSYDEQKNNNWVINGGILHGIRPTSEGETFLAIFPQGSTQEELQNIDNAICKAKLTKVFTEVSVAEIIEGNSVLSQNEPLWAIVTEVPLPKLKVCILGEANGVELARTELAKINSGEASLFVRETESLTDADYYLEAVEGQFWIEQTADKKPLVAPVPEVQDTQGYTANNANVIVKRLEHIARWKNILELKTPPTSQIKAGDVEMEVIINSGDNQYSSKTETSAMRGEYAWDGMDLEPPGINVKISNKSEQDIHFQVIGLDGDYSIQLPDLFNETKSILLPTGKVAEGEEIEITIPKEYLDNGINEYDSILKLIVSTREFDASLLTQPGLDNPPPTNRSSDLPGTINQLMSQVYTRAYGRRVKDKKIDNWMTQEVKFTLVKPPGGVEIKQSESTNLLTGVKVQPHPIFKGKFSINPLPPSSRNVNSNIVPPTFVQEQTVVERGGKRLSEPYNFNMTRGGGGNLSLLEIVDIENYQSVTPENPIKLLVDKQLSLDEYLLPIAYDGEFFLPLGKAKTVNGRTEIILERLPEPTVDSRSLQGSIKILFQKVVYESAGKRLGFNFEYPLLRIANVSKRGRVTYNINANEIKTKVAEANKILLYIHGIIGDTESLLPSILTNTTKNADETLQDKYDLILAFDYENL
ncbi:MAG: caspase family protein, partial [Cyanobacteria bacterium P01_C01_bin.38]